MPEASRRSPSPWRADPMPGGMLVRDANGQARACLYSRDNEAEARQATVNDAVSGHIHKSALALNEPRRYRDREHLKFVSTQPYLVCARRP